VKCPKCQYLGFDAGGRCKNCGYDFSLISDASGAPALEIDRSLRGGDEDEPAITWDDTFVLEQETDSGAATAPPPIAPPTPVAIPTAAVPPVVGRFAADRKLPLFSPVPDHDDEPLIKLPVAPRPPLAVRRTPDAPRLKAVPRRARSSESEPGLQFVEDAASGPSIVMPPGRAPVTPIRQDVRTRPAAALDASSRVARLVAMALDHVLLTGIDLAVVYLTVRMAGLPMSSWMELPMLPLGLFLLLLKLAYFGAFTAVGGQTIGKMAMHIRVMTVENRPLDPGAAALRTLAGALSAGLLGVGYLPALIGSDPRTLHDRVARTRVVALPPA
jgi:uncharacterized RDD family membrane protein YckC